MDITKRSAGRVPLHVNYWITAIKLTIVVNKLNIYNLKLFSLWYMQILKWFQFLLQRISSLKHDILCFPIMSTLKVTWPEVPSNSYCLHFQPSGTSNHFDIRIERPKPDILQDVIDFLKKILDFCLCCVTCGCYRNQGETNGLDADEYGMILLDNEKQAVQNLLQYLENGENYTIIWHTYMYNKFSLYVFDMNIQVRYTYWEVTACRSYIYVDNFYWNGEGRKLPTLSLQPSPFQ